MRVGHELCLREIVIKCIPGRMLLDSPNFRKLAEMLWEHRTAIIIIRFMVCSALMIRPITLVDKLELSLCPEGPKTSVTGSR